MTLMTKTLSSWKKFKSADKVSLLGLIVVFGFSLINLFRSCNQDQQIAQLTYQVNAVNFQPKIRIVDTPVLKKYWFDSTLVKISMKDFFSPDTTSEIPTYAIKKPVNLTLNLKLINSGNSLGKILAVLTADTTSDEPVLRKMLLDGSFKEQRSSFFPPYLNTELLPNDMDTLEYTHQEQVDFIDNQYFTLHLLILYENELGHLYDTYYWSRAKLEELLFPSPFGVKGNRIYMLTRKSFKIALKDLVTFTNSKISYNTYDDRKQAELIKHRIKESRNKLTKNQD